jgi:hypothetical protein
MLLLLLPLLLVLSCFRMLGSIGAADADNAVRAFSKSHGNPHLKHLIKESV